MKKKVSASSCELIQNTKSIVTKIEKNKLENDALFFAETALYSVRGVLEEVKPRTQLIEKTLVEINSSLILLASYTKNLREKMMKNY